MSLCQQCSQIIINHIFLADNNLCYILTDSFNYFIIHYCLPSCLLLCCFRLSVSLFLIISLYYIFVWIMFKNITSFKCKQPLLNAFNSNNYCQHNYHCHYIFCIFIKMYLLPACLLRNNYNFFISGNIIRCFIMNSFLFLINRIVYYFIIFD